MTRLLLRRLFLSAELLCWLLLFSYASALAEPSNEEDVVIKNVEHYIAVEIMLPLFRILP